MLILRKYSSLEEKEFAKTDKMLAKKLGKTVKEIRKNRNTDFSMVSGNSVNHRINEKVSDYVAADMASSTKLFPKDICTIMN